MIAFILHFFTHRAAKDDPFGLVAALARRKQLRLNGQVQVSGYVRRRG